MDKLWLTKRLVDCAPVEWGDIATVVHKFYGGAFPIWEFAERACLAVGGTAEQSWDCCSALFCAVASVRLVDDILDEDSGGEHHQLGIGRTANLAMAFQALGTRMLASSGAAAVDPKVIEAYARACIDTGYGQELDARGADDEALYWRQVEAKTPPLFSRALEMGARVAGASEDMVVKLVALGFVLAKLVQIGDDMTDALARPAKEDWARPGNNLPLLFASTVAHGERDEFVRLLPQVSNGEALARAQDILTRSGAISYCAFKMYECAQDIDRLLSSMDFANPKPVLELIDHSLNPLRGLFAILGDGNAMGELAQPYVRAGG